MDIEEARIIAKTLYKKEIVGINESSINGIKEIVVIFEDKQEVIFSPFHPLGIRQDKKTLPEGFIEGIQESLLEVNIAVLLFFSGLAYFFAGKTMLPIKNKLRREEQFIQDAAHELRNPLSCIKIVSQTELKKGPSKIWEDVLEETNRLIHISEWLLLLSKKNTGKKELIELKEFIEWVVKTLSPFSAKKNIYFQLEIPVFMIYEERTEVEKIIFNIVHNAIKFSKMSGKIIIKLQTDGTLSIEDFWCGVAQTDLPLLFERFYKTDSSRSFINGGSGLGLSIVKKTLETMWSYIEVKSVFKKWTIFILGFKRAKKNQNLSWETPNKNQK